MDSSAKVLIILISFFFFFLYGIDAGCGPCDPCGPCNPCGPCDPCGPCGPQAGGGAVELTGANFDCQVTNNCDPWVVMFATPWCGFAKKLQPEFDQAANNLQGKAKFGKVNCDVEKGLCGRFGIRAYPTVKGFPAKDKSNPVECWDRTTADLEYYVNNELTKMK